VVVKDNVNIENAKIILLPVGRPTRPKATADAMISDKLRFLIIETISIGMH
jgi:hypothetical protein